MIGCGVDGSGGRRYGERDVDRCDMQRLGSEGVGEMDAECGTADGEVDDLADGGVAQVVGRERILRFGNLLRCSPGGYPWLGWDGSRRGGMRDRACRQGRCESESRRE